MWQFLVKTWNSILEIWQLSKDSRLVAEITICLIIGIWSLQLWALIMILPPILLQISSMRAELTPWLLFLAAVSMHYFANREKQSSLNLQTWKLHEIITLQIGNYYDVLNNEGNKVIRITLKKISKQLMPLPYSNIGNCSHQQIEAETATLSFDDLLSIIPGQAVVSVPASMPFTESLFAFSKNANSEEVNSVFFFSTIGHEQFFRCFVDHINPAKQEVEIDVYFLQMKKV